MIPSIRAARASSCSSPPSDPSSPTSAGHLGAGHDRDVQREHLVTGAPERRLGCRQHPGVVGPGVVELGHHHRTRHPDVGALAPQHRGDRSTGSLAAVTNSAQSAARSPARSSPTKSAYPGVSMRLTFTPRCTTGRHGERHRAAVRPLAGLEVGDRGAVGDRPGAGQGAAADEQGLQEGRLATGARAHQHDVAYLIGLEGLEILSAGCTSSFVRHGDTLLLLRRPDGNPWHGQIHSRWP